MNFDYLSQFPELKKLHTYCAEAEDFALTRPSISATSARKAMELVVKLIYASLLGQDYGLTVFEMISDVRFVKYVGDPTMINSMHYIRKMGNVAVHEGDLTADEAKQVLKELHFVVGEFAILLGLVRDYPQFATPTVAPVRPVEPTPEKKVVLEPELIAKFAERMRVTKFQVHRGRDEAENKQLFLRASLREAGWPLVNRDNQAMPCAAGLNILLDDGDSVDYVLYGRDNRPLAVIEYTATGQNLLDGRAKAIAKADKLAQKYGYKPVAYYTNGYYIYVIDQLGYKPRRVFQFHSLEELELLKLRAGSRQDIREPQIDEAIAGRDYQKQAITAACNAFADMRRGALLVMATGTGKTRVSIALADVLLKSGWVKNILFLADRTSLVRQAHKNFTKLLPSVTTSVYSGGSMNRDSNARIIFSTYQTMIGLIEDDTREFGIGRFDLIIIDEAHRSIFNKYRTLFTYFDSLLLGLTATPRVEDNKSTYKTFGLQDREPDFAYELEQAIDDGYLVGFSVQDRTTDALRRGIHYDELSDEDKAAFEDAFATGDDEEADFAGSVIEAQRFKNRKYINLGTIDAMLNDLMQNGLKVDGGDSLGKTIIFARSHEEAEKIVERFQTLYARLGMDYCKLIDSRVVDSLGLIDSFEVRGKLPQIAVSVDMLDTGIDVPDVLNLVFFKPVQSKIKFLQMIGRGTRLSPDIFGSGENKQGFLIFDYFDNFGFFRTRHTWSVVDDTRKNKSWSMTPQSVLINQRKLNILCALIEKSDRTPFEEQYKNDLKTYFITAVQGLCNDDIMVQSNMAYVSKYRTAEKWDGFTAEKLVEIEDFILPLLPPLSNNMKVKTFDLMMYVVEDEVPRRMADNKDIRKIRHGFGNVGKKIGAMMAELGKLKTIPEILAKEQLIAQMDNADLLFEDFSLEKCERVRLELRDLMQYISDKSPVYILHSDDVVIDIGSGQGMEQEKTYVQKVLEYIAAGSPELAKIRNLDELTEEEKSELEQVFKAKLGNAADYVAWAGSKPLPAMLRVQVGIADEAIQTRFGSFLNSDELGNEQLAYMQQIISYARENGDVTFMDLQKVSPLCDVDIMELFGAKVGHVKTLINGLHRPVM